MILRLPALLLIVWMSGVVSCAAPRPVTGSLMDRAADANRQGVHAFAQGSMNTAEADFQRALQLNRRIDYRRGALDNLNNLAALRLKKGNPEGALIFLQEGLAIAEELKDLQGEIDLRIHLGVAREMQGDFEGALSSYTRAETLAQTLGYPDRLQAAVERRGQLKLSLEKWEEAEGDLRTAYELARSRSDERGMAMGESDLGLLALDQGNLEEASTLLTSALKRHRTLETPSGIALDLQRLGRLYHRQGVPEKAETFLQRAFSSHQADGNAIGAFQDLMILTRIYQTRGEGEKALKTFKKSEKFLPGIHRKSMVADYHKMEKELQKVFP